MEDSQAFYVRRQGRIEGPWSLTKLRAEIGLRKLGRHHEMSTDGANWRRAGDFEGLFVSVETRKRVGRVSTAASSPAQAEPVVANSGEIELELDESTAVSLPVAWHYSIDAQHFGPVREDEIIRELQAGRLPLDALVWREGYADWLTVEEVPELMARIDDSWRHTSSAEMAATRFVTSGPEKQPRFPGYALWGGIASLLLSWIPFVGFAGVIPIVFGVLGINEVNSAPQGTNGLGRAIAGIMLGLASVALAAIELTVLGYVVWQNLVE